MTRLLLVGGGHAHVFVLDALARNKPAGLEVTLVSPHSRQLYSGMLPAWVAGRLLRVEDLAIPLAPLAERAGARLHLARVEGLDLKRRRALTDRGTSLDFDLISIASGSTTAALNLPGAIDHAVPLRPLEAFVEIWQQQYLAMLGHPRGSTHVSFIGGGAAGVELALAMAWRLRKLEGAVRLQLVTGGQLLPGFPQKARSLAAHLLSAAKVRLVLQRATSLERGLISLDDGSTLTSDVNLLTTGPAPAPWLATSGLATDDAGYVAVNAKLQSTSHDFVFAAGDCASLVESPRPHSGVFAVRAGPPLARNLIAAATGTPLADWKPQQRSLLLLSEGERRALGVWGPLAFEGEWVARWKDSIDRRFMRRFGATL